MDGIVLLGNPPMYRTGYGTQLNLLGRSLVDAGYAVAHVCDFGYAGHMFTLDGVDVYGCDELPGQLTSTTLRNHIRDWRKRHMIDNWCLIGLGNVHNWVGLTRDVRNSLLMVPVDGNDLKSHDIDAMHSCGELAGISQFGGEIIHKHFPNPSYLPHGYDPQLVRLNRSQRAVRATATFQQAADCFLVGFLGDASIRKCPAENLEAFMRFAEGKTDVRLWIKGSNHNQAQDLSAQLEMLPQGMVLKTSDYDSQRGLDTNEMAELLRGLDVLLHCSSQEGFGIFQIEAQALGTPVINTGFGPMIELNAHSDLVVPVSHMRQALDVEYGVPDIDGIVVRLEQLYSEWKDGSIGKRRQDCSNWAEQYSFDTIFEEHFLPTIARLLQSGANMDQPSLVLNKPKRLNRIAFLSTYDTHCGIATYTKMLAEAVSELGVEVVILAEGTDEHPIGDSDIKGPIKVVRCWDRRFDAGAALHDAINQFQPDLVHIQHEWALFSRSRELWEVLRESDVRIAVTYHTPDFVEQHHEPAWSHLYAHSSFVDGVIVHNEFIARSIRGKIFPPVCHIDHGIRALPVIPDARDETKIPEGVPMLLNYGFASNSKGTLDLIRAVDIVKERGNCPYFEVVVFAGDHPHWEMDPYLKQCSEESKGIPGLSFVREFIEDDKLDVMLSATDFIVYPYSGVPGHEILSTSGAVMRGLGAGKPVICTDEGRLRDILGGGHGFKASMRSPESLADAIEHAVGLFHSSKAQYRVMCDNVVALAESRSWPIIARRHLDVYQRLCSVWSIRPDRVMPARPVWLQNNAQDILDYEAVESSELDEGEEE